MITMELSAGESISIGSRTLKVLAVRAGEVVVALGELKTTSRRCPICRARVGPGSSALEPWYCPRCGFTWDESQV